MKIGYARGPTEDQNPDLQLTALKLAGCDRIFTDKATGADVKRSELVKCFKSLKAGDMLMVWKLDRLGRSLCVLIALLDDLKAQDIAFRSLTEDSDAETATGRAMWLMVEVLAELERSLNQGTHKGGPCGRYGPWCANGPQAAAFRATDHPCTEIDRAGGKSGACRKIAQGVAPDALQGFGGYESLLYTER